MNKLANVNPILDSCVEGNLCQPNSMAAKMPNLFFCSVMSEDKSVMPEEERKGLEDVPLEEVKGCMPGEEDSLMSVPGVELVV